MSGGPVTRPAAAADGAPTPAPDGAPAAAPRGHRLRDGLAVAGVACLLLAVWQAIVIVGGYPPFILPGPLVVGERLVRAIAQGTIAPHLLTTLSEVLLGLAAGVAAALVLGFLLARSRVADRILSPWLVAAQATPILALAPLIVLWFGSGLSSKVLICALICFFPMVVATSVGVRSIDPRLVELARSLRATRRQLILTVEVPAALPQILGGLKVAATLAVVGAIVAEWVGGDKGLGVLINLARGSLFDIPLMFATLVVIAALGVALYLSVVLVEHRITGARTQ